MKRLFIAIPVYIQPELEKLLHDLKICLREDKINWVSPLNMHITLQFLGETPETSIPILNRIIRETALEFPEGETLLEGLGYFGSKKDPKVIFTRIQGHEQLSAMANKLHELTGPEGFLTDHPEFKAHLTLGRIKYIHNKDRFFDAIKSIGNQPIQKVEIQEIVLFESVLRPQGPVYRSISRHRMSGK